MTVRRVALIAWDYPPASSGLAVAAREIAESLAETGVKVCVYTLDRSKREHHGGVCVVGCLPELSGTQSFWRRRMALGHLVAPRWFAKRIEADHARRAYDCLEATNWYAPGALAGRIRGLPFVTRHSTPAVSTGALAGSPRDRLDGRFACWLEASSARRSDGHIFNTQSHGEKVSKLYRLADDVPRAVIGLSLPPERRVAANNAAYPLERGPIEILFVGRAEQRKGFDCLLGAVDLLAKEVQANTLPAFRLRLVGIAPSDLDGLSALARNRAEPLGRLSDSELDDAYRSAHLIAAPSRYESFGLVYQEALAFGRPVVGLAVDPSARQVVGTSGAGRLASAATGEALADALRPLIARADLRLEMRERALAAAGQFSRQRLGSETLMLYEAVADRHSQGR